MFSLIITIISIALVAALALATLYYGGDAFKRGAASADATKLHVQSQQLQGAAELYKADTGAYPLTMEAMLTGNYLKSIPVSSLDPAQEQGSSPALMDQASAAGVVWKMVLAGQPVFAMTQVSVAVCEAVNMKAYGTAGVLKSARAGYSTQCFGTDLNNLTMVTTKSGAALITASLSPLATVSLGTVLSTAPPAVNSGDTTDAGWLTVEGVTVAAVTPPLTPPVAPVQASTSPNTLTYMYTHRQGTAPGWTFVNLTNSDIVVTDATLLDGAAYFVSTNFDGFYGDAPQVIVPLGWVSTGYNDGPQGSAGLHLSLIVPATGASYHPSQTPQLLGEWCLSPDSGRWVDAADLNKDPTNFQGGHCRAYGYSAG